MRPEFFFETFLSLVITEVWDFTIDKIKKVYKEHKNVPENQKTFQSRMYTAIIDAFCMYAGVNPDEAQDDVMEFICCVAKEYYEKSYKKQDTSTDTLLSSIKTLESRFGSTLLQKGNTEDEEKIILISDFLQVYIADDPGFRHIYVIKSLDNLKSKGYQIEKNHLNLRLFAEEEIEKAVQRLSVFIRQDNDRVIDEIKQDNKRQKAEILAAIKAYSPYVNTEKRIHLKEQKRKFKDAKKEYVKKWNERLFLHRRPGDKELTLRNTYIPTLYETIIPENDRNDEPQDNLNEKLEQFIDHGKSLLLIGPPGIGKTSIVCYLAKKYEKDPDVVILRFSDWSEEEWNDLVYNTHGSLLAKAITHKLECTEKDLKDKTLILDGFDEIKYYSRSNDLLKSFLLQIRNIRGLRVIITSRDNYINISEVKFQNIIKLCPFNNKKIVRFISLISSEVKIDEADLHYIDQEVYGNPVILYMAITIGINIKEKTNRCKTYEKIFALNGGIFDRFATESIEGYDEYPIADISYVKESFINILCKSAFTMFFRNQDNKINIIEYNEIIKSEYHINPTKSELWYDFPIDNLYEKGNDIQFIHRSIYEYFVAEYIIRKIKNEFDCTESNLVQKCSTTFANLFCRNMLPKEICVYVDYKISNYINTSQSMINTIINIIVNILTKGSTIYISKDILNYLVYEKKENVIDVENVVFWNLLYLLQAIAPKINNTVNSNELIQHISRYIKTNSLQSIDLSYYKICGPHTSLDPTNEATNLKHLTEIYKKNHIYAFCGTLNNLQDFGSAFLSNIKMDSSLILNINLNNAILNYAKINNSIFIDLMLNNSSCSDSIWDSTTFLDVKFTHSNMDNAWFSDCYFINTDFSFSLLKYAALTNLFCEDQVMFRNTYFEHTEINGKFNNVNFNDSKIISCNLSGEFNDASFEGVIFEENVKFKNGDFSNANFKNAKFIDNIFLEGGIFKNADFRGADLSGAIYEHELDYAILD